VNLVALCDSARELAHAAGEAILEIYRGRFEVEYKDDRSPLTAADLAAHRILVAGLSTLSPALPVLSEESAATVPFAERRAWRRYWLVDPLDGTREFVKRNDEFTVNIALVEDGEPVLGILHAPALGEMAWAVRGEGACLDAGDGARRLHGRRSPDVPVVAVSRSHVNPSTQVLLDAIGEHGTLSAGSALKFIRIAQGQVDLYPRLGPTSEWDTAAGHCLLDETGGAIYDVEGRPLRYNQRESLLNPHFLAVGDVTANWPQRLAQALHRDEASPPSTS
jgi:3'(2'), 5'-bisphosphate nucleotidase